MCLCPLTHTLDARLPFLAPFCGTGAAGQGHDPVGAQGRGRGAHALGIPSGQDQDKTMVRSRAAHSPPALDGNVLARYPGSHSTRARAEWEPQPGVMSDLSDFGGGQGTGLGHCSDMLKLTVGGKK